MAKTELAGTCGRVESRIEDYLKEIDLSSTTVIYSTWVQQLFTDPGNNVSQTRTNHTNAIRFLSNFASIFGDLNCFIVLDDNSYIQNNQNYVIDPEFHIEQQAWYEQLVRDGKYRIYGHNDMFRKNNRKDAICTTYYVIRSIYNQEMLGYFVNSIPYEHFYILEQQLNSNEQLLIKDQNDNIVFSNMEPTLASYISSMVPGEDMNEEMDPDAIMKYGSELFYAGIVNENGWRIMIAKEENTIWQSLTRYGYIFLLLIPVLILYTVVTIAFGRYLTKPIVLCTQALHEVGAENYNVYIPNEYKDEIGDMIDGFNDMTSSISRLMDINEAMYKARREAEFRIHQQRINPHFLCNTLEIINGMILCKEEDKALELTGMLGSMYRYDLGEREMASVAEELSYLNKYLSILSYKYRNLRVECEADACVLDYVIPKFICQPLIENSFKHGFHERMEERSILIDLTEENHILRILIADSGVGMDEEVLEEMQKKICMLKEDQTIGIEEHVGVLNVARRIFLHYGSQCRFDVMSEKGRGVVIQISIPVKCLKDMSEEN